MTAVQMFNELIALGHIVPVENASADFVMPSAYIDAGSVTVYGFEVESVGDDAELEPSSQRD